MRRTLWVSVCALSALACRGEPTTQAQKETPWQADYRPADRPDIGAQSAEPKQTATTAHTPARNEHSSLADRLPTGAPTPTTPSRDLEPGAPSRPDHSRPDPLRRDHGHGHGHVPFAPCPIAEEQRGDAAALLAQATLSHQAGNYALAYDCASAATDAAPRSIDAHHIRAASAAALGRFETAQLAFALALALDPDDPATLSAAADFYINAMPRHSREPILVGLEYARRGRSQAIVRRGVKRQLRAQLTLLEAQALNDMGRPDEALSRVDEALRLTPKWLEAYHERGVALFNLCRFNGAKDAFAQVIRGAPGDAFAHHHLGLIHEHLGRAARSEHHFRKARSLSPADFRAPVEISVEEFKREVDRAVTELPVDLQVMLEDVAIEVVDLPSLEDLTAVEPPFSPTILGLFRGLPLTVESAAYSRDIPPRAIVLYRKNLARMTHSRAELNAQIRRTLMHEIGHLSGLDEDELRRRGLE